MTAEQRSIVSRHVSSLRLHAYGQYTFRVWLTDASGAVGAPAEHVTKAKAYLTVERLLAEAGQPLTEALA